MRQALREFFIQEATEYLDKLAATLAVDGRPDFDRLRRLARALKGSARMADQEAIADAADALQTVAADLEGGDRRWDDRLAETLKSALGELRQLVDAVHEPPADLGERAQALVRRLGGGEPPAKEEPFEDVEFGDDQLRKYLGSELQRLADTIRDAIGQLERDPRDREPLKRLLRRVRPLRGVQSLGEIRAVGPALAALEEVILRIADTSAAVGPGHLTLFGRAREALAEVAADFLRGEEPGAAPKRRAEIEGLKDQVLHGPAQREVSWISELFYDDGGPHLEACPMAERGAGSWEAFFALEATGSLDTADRLCAEMARDPEGVQAIGERLAYTFRQLRERALTFGHSEFGRVAHRTAAVVRAGLRTRPAELQGLSDALEPVVQALRGYLRAPDETGREEALEQAEMAIDRAAEPRKAAPVPMESLTYEPEGALRRALELQGEVRKLLRDDFVDRGRLRIALDEVFELIEHALAGGRP